MDAFKFADLCRTMLNIDRDELENAGVLTPGKTDDGGTSWKRWNDDWRVFVAKLDDERLQALFALLQQHNPKAFEPAGLLLNPADVANLIDLLRACRVYVHVANIAAAHQSQRPVLEHTGAVIRNIDNALTDLGFSENEEPTNEAL